MKVETPLNMFVITLTGTNVLLMAAVNLGAPGPSEPDSHAIPPGPSESAGCPNNDTEALNPGNVCFDDFGAEEEEDEKEPFDARKERSLLPFLEACLILGVVPYSILLAFMSKRRIPHPSEAPTDNDFIMEEEEIEEMDAVQKQNIRKPKVASTKNRKKAALKSKHLALPKFTHVKKSNNYARSAHGCSHSRAK